MAEEFRSGFVTLVGRPNAGKSTLINAIMGKKIAITSSTVQTTRHRFRAVLNRPDFQLILVDTPGLHKPQDALGEELNTSALKALEDVDVAAFLVDASKPIGKGDRWIAEQVQRSRAKKICVLSKIDLATEQQISAQREAAEQLGQWDAMVALSAVEQVQRSRAKKICVLSKIDLATEQQISAQREAAEQLGQWDAMVALSAVTGYNVEAFVEEAEQLLPPGPAWFPRDMETDQPLEVMIAEFIREKILRSFSDEIPHAIGVAVDGFEYDRKKDLYRIFAIIYVERDSQKGIIIGKKGQAIKAVGIEAREDLEHLLGCRVFLDLSVKVRKNWRRDANQIRRFGYGDGVA